ncbi:MAG: hypothetical protein ACJ76Y_13805 [Thermoanaerobaculia bacterium]
MGERREFLRGIFGQARKAKIWSHIDLEAAARALGAPHDRLVRALDYLAEQRLLEVRAAGLRHPYHWLRRPDDLDALASSLHQRTLERETREIARLDQVLTLAAPDGCQTAFLAAHFGEQLPSLRPLLLVRERRPARGALPAGPHPPGRRETAPRGEPAPGDPRPGLPPSPRPLPDRPPLPPPDPRQAQNPTPLFGAFAHVPFADVLRRVEEGEGDGRERSALVKPGEQSTHTPEQAGPARPKYRLGG